MPIRNFNGKTFVAFMDISGFKELMKEKRALKALDYFYKYGYRVLRENESQIEGLFVSDSGILFVRNCQNKTACLRSLLAIIREINMRMCENDFMLTTSIAYGPFRYEDRIEFRGIDKNLLYGHAFISTYLDTENGKPEIQPGQCRIVKKNLPEEVKDVLENSTHNDVILQLIKRRRGDKTHYYFYWMRENPSEIDNFEKQYTDLSKSIYAGMLRLLKGET